MAGILNFGDVAPTNQAFTPVESNTPLPLQAAYVAPHGFRRAVVNRNNLSAAMAAAQAGQVQGVPAGYGYAPAPPQLAPYNAQPIPYGPSALPQDSSPQMLPSSLSGNAVHPNMGVGQGAPGGTSQGFPAQNAQATPQQQPQAPAAPQQPQGFQPNLNNAMSDGLINAGAAMLQGKGFMNGMGAAGAAFNNAYEGRIDKDRAEGTPKVVPMAGGAFTMLVHPNGTQQIVSNDQVQKYTEDATNRANEFMLKKLGINLAGQAGLIDKRAGAKVMETNTDAGANRANIDELRSLATQLPQTGASGPLIGLAPKAVRDVVNPQGSDIEDRVRRIVQAGAKNALGSQYTEREGELLFNTGYNPRLSPEQNAQRLNDLANRLESMQNNKDALINHLRNGGTSANFVAPAAGSGGGGGVLSPQTSNGPAWAKYQ